MFSLKKVERRRIKKYFFLIRILRLSLSVSLSPAKRRVVSDWPREYKLPELSLFWRRKLSFSDAKKEKTEKQGKMFNNRTN